MPPQRSGHGAQPWVQALGDTPKGESLSSYRDLGEARASIREFLENVYSQKRLHSALGSVPPVEFKAIWQPQTTTSGTPY